MVMAGSRQSGGTGDRAQRLSVGSRWVRKVRPPQGRALVKSGGDSSPLKARKSLWRLAGAASESATETIPPLGEAARWLSLPAAGALALPSGKGEKVG